MTDQVKGLRFDIYERVDLAETAEGIIELEEVELTPNIQLSTTDTQAILHGHLRLTGVYIGDRSNESHRLEHPIPVEITLPLKRIPNLDQVSVEIDNFDIDVLSVRRLSVTGVLSLGGIETDHVEMKEHNRNKANMPFSPVNPKLSGPLLSANNTEETPLKRESWVNSLQERPNIAKSQQNKTETADSTDVSKDGERAVSETSVNETIMSEANARDEKLSEQPLELSESQHGTDEQIRPETVDHTYEAADEQLPMEQPTIQSQESAVNTEGHATPTFASSPPPEVDSSHEQPSISAEQMATPAIGTEQSDDLVVESEETSAAFMLTDDNESSEQASDEIKIAFSSQKSMDDTPVQASELQQLAMQRDDDHTFQTHDAELGEMSDESAEVEPEANEAKTERANPHTEWMSFLLNRDIAEERQFSKVRMCIVQKEETLDTIADRYELNPREIILYNRLGDQELSEGQVVYIPK